MQQNQLPLISVIIPVYKNEPYLERCICSIREQQYRHLEIILVDDGSPDRCGSMCDAYARQDARIRVIHQANGGLSAARNAGLAISTGQLVAFVDSDDYVSSEYISRLYQLHERFGADIAVCGFSDVRGERTTPWRIPVGEPFALDALSALQNMLYTDDFDASAWGKLFPRVLFDTVRFPVGKLYEEVETTWRLLMMVQRVAITREPLYYYVKHEGSIVSSRFNEHSLDMLEACRHIYDYAASEHLELLPAATRKLVYACFYLLKTLGKEDRDHPEVVMLLYEVLRRYRFAVLRDPRAPKRDKVAILISLAGQRAFRFSWMLYCRCTHREA